MIIEWAFSLNLEDLLASEPRWRKPGMKRRQRSFNPQLRPVKLVLRSETEFDEVNEPKNLYRFLPVAITVFDSQAGRRSVLNKTLYGSLASKVNTLEKMRGNLLHLIMCQANPKQPMVS